MFNKDVNNFSKIFSHFFVKYLLMFFLNVHKIFQFLQNFPKTSLYLKKLFEILVIFTNTYPETQYFQEFSYIFFFLIIS